MGKKKKQKKKVVPETASNYTWWEKVRKAVRPHRFYGDGGTIHGTTHVDVETYNGTVVAVWFRCSTLRFDQHEVNQQRAIEMEQTQGKFRLVQRSQGPSAIVGIVFEDSIDEDSNG